MAEAKRLAGLAPGEWQIWIGKRAQEIGVERSILEKVTKEVLKDTSGPSVSGMPMSARGNAISSRF
jgi:hypothetical protein